MHVQYGEASFLSLVYIREPVSEGKTLYGRELVGSGLEEEKSGV